MQIKSKHYVWIGLVVFCIILGIVGVVVVNSFRNFPASEAKIFTTPELTLSVTPTALYPVSTPVVTVTPALPQEQSLWKVQSIEDNALAMNGYQYDVAIFVSVSDSTKTLKANCMAPGWPSPEIGHVYFLNEYGVLAPIEGVNSKLQRFSVIK